MQPDDCILRCAGRRILRVVVFPRIICRIDDVIIHHVAVRRAELHIGPVLIAFQHRQRLTVAQSGKDRGIGRRRGAQVERLAFVRKGDSRRAYAACRWRGFLHAVLLNGQVAGHHIARERTVLNFAPIAQLFQQIDLRSVRHTRQNRGRRACLLTQIKAVQRVLQGDDRNLRVGYGFIRRLRRAVDGGEQGSRHRVARARQPWIIEFENLVVADALVRHLLCAALAHADAMTETPRRQLVAADRFRNGQRFIFQHVDGHGAKPFDLRKIIQRNRHIAIALQRHADQHLLVNAGRRGVFRLIR